jgi:poly-gamma-glutamate capsule biosynthesis protein CapA/YwtB (metallophosphatase superfamily)
MRIRTFLLLSVAYACGASPSPQTEPTPNDPLLTSGDDPGTSDTLIVVHDPVATLPDSDVVVVTGPDPARALELIEDGRALLQAGTDIDGAIARFQEAIATDSAATAAHWELGRAFQMGQRWTEAVAAWETLEQLDPNHPGLAMHFPILRMRKDRAEALASLPVGVEVSPPEEKPRDGVPIRLSAVGDIQLGAAWPEAAAQLPPDNARGILMRVAHLLQRAEITFGNLETVLADSGESTKCRRGSRNCYAFRVPAAYAATLGDVGFDVVSANNNHAADFGEAGQQATVNALEAAQILHSGSLSGVASWETNGLRIAMIAFSTGDGPYRVQDIETARQLVIEAGRDHDLVIVSFHGGAEGGGAQRVPRAVERAYGENRGNVYAFSHTLVDAGADLILGHGPHVLRGMEIYRGRLIAYSLGNFASWHGFNLTDALGLSAVLNVTLAPNGVVTEASIDPVYLEEPGIPTPDPQRRAIEIVRRLSRLDFGNSLFDPTGRWVRQP